MKRQDPGAFGNLLDAKKKKGSIRVASHWLRTTLKNMRMSYGEKKERICKILLGLVHKKSYLSAQF